MCCLLGPCFRGMSGSVALWHLIADNSIGRCYIDGIAWIIRHLCSSFPQYLRQNRQEAKTPKPLVKSNDRLYLGIGDGRNKAPWKPVITWLWKASQSCPAVSRNICNAALHLTLIISVKSFLDHYVQIHAAYRLIYQLTVPSGACAITLPAVKAWINDAPRQSVGKAKANLIGEAGRWVGAVVRELKVE